MLNGRLIGSLRVLCVAAMMALLTPGVAAAQDTLGGHYGILFPLITRSGGETTSIGDPFQIGFPMGITVKTTDKVAFDLELVPVIQRTPFVVGLTVHPGLLYALENNYTAGIRMAFDVNGNAWGFTPLINRKFTNVGRVGVFGELVIPIRFQEDNNAVGIGIHIGMGF